MNTAAVATQGRKKPAQLAVVCLLLCLAAITGGVAIYFAFFVKTIAASTPPPSSKDQTDQPTLLPAVTGGNITVQTPTAPIVVSEYKA
jgi:hypothetical protein